MRLSISLGIFFLLFASFTTQGAPTPNQVKYDLHYQIQSKRIHYKLEKQGDKRFFTSPKNNKIEVYAKNFDWLSGQIEKSISANKKPDGSCQFARLYIFKEVGPRQTKRVICFDDLSELKPSPKQEPALQAMQALSLVTE